MTETATFAPYVPELNATPPSFVIELTEFSGPLDLLLTLIREEQVDIYDIPIARIAAQFVQRIRTLQLNEAADYLEMAARLVRMRTARLVIASSAQRLCKWRAAVADADKWRAMSS